MNLDSLIKFLTPLHVVTDLTVDLKLNNIDFKVSCNKLILDVYFD